MSQSQSLKKGKLFCAATPRWTIFPNFPGLQLSCCCDTSTSRPWFSAANAMVTTCWAKNAEGECCMLLDKHCNTEKRFNIESWNGGVYWKPAKHPQNIFFLAIRIPSLKAKLIDFQQFSLKDCNSCWPIVKSASFQSASIFNSRSRLNFMNKNRTQTSPHPCERVKTSEQKKTTIKNTESIWWTWLNLDHLHSFAIQLSKSITAIS